MTTIKDINVYLRENLREVAEKNISIAPGIEEKKLNNAVKAFGFSGDPATVVALLDSSMLGNGKEGILFTGAQLIYRTGFSSPISIPYSSIDSIDCIQAVTGAKNDKIQESLLIRRSNNAGLSIKGLGKCNYRKLAETLQACIGADKAIEYKEERQLISIDGLSEPLKVAYVQSIINSAYDSGGAIDDREFAEILQLMTRFDLRSETRFTLRTYMSSRDAQIPLEVLLEKINAHTPSDQIQALHISLVKDLINIFYSSGGRDISSFEFLQKNRDHLKVRDEEVELAMLAIKNDYDMLRDDITDNQIVLALKDLSARAAAVGVPLAAVYLSGSVVGMSAAGMTSGLATLGMGGLLGMSGMVTGIGVVVLIGVGAYTGIRKLTGSNELTRSKRRALMLNEVIKQTQITISLLMEDMNFITGKLNQAIQAHGAQDIKIQKLVRLMSQMTGAGAVLSAKSDSAQASATKLRCAQYLNEGKLKSLTREPTKAEFFNFIRSYYEESSVAVSSKDEEEHNEIKLVIKSGVTSRELDKLANAFEVIGYFNAGDVIKGSAGGLANKALGKFTGLVS